MMVVLLGATTALAYRNTLPGQFVYDDKKIIFNNPLIQKLDRIPLLFGTPYWGMNIGQPKTFKGSLYRPLTMVTFALNYYVGALDPNGYHVMNLVLHIGVSLLLWLLCLRLGIGPSAARAAAFLFAVLPIHTEAVSNIVGRSELLSSFFVLLAWNLATGHPRRRHWVLGSVSFMLALLSKENAAALLPVLILTDYVIYKTSWKTLANERLLVWVAYAGALLLYLEWRYLIIGSITNAGGIPYFISQNGLEIYLTMARFILFHYLRPLVLGIGLCADYTRPALADARVGDISSWAWAFLLSGAVAYAFYSVIKKRNLLSLCVIIFFGLLFPVSNLLMRLEVIGAERFVYLPSLGYCMGVGLLLEKTMRSKILKSSGEILVLASLILWYGWRTYDRNKAWQTEESFWSTTVQDAPRSPRSWNGVGYVLMTQKKYDEAIQDFNKALQLNPMLLDADYNMATCFFLEGDYRRAKKGYLYVAQWKPYDPGTLFHLAYLAEKEHDIKSAEKYYVTILTANPWDEMARMNLGKLETRRRAGEVQL